MMPLVSSTVCEFETHLTVAAPDSERLRDWCFARALKFSHIVLERGQTPSQPMISRWGVGSFEQEHAVASTLSAEAQRAGFSVVRMKLEVEAEQADDFLSSDGYFEHHLKLLLTPEADLGALYAALPRHGAHLSRNARRIRHDGQSERFVTQRCYHDDREAARAAFELLHSQLLAQNLKVLEVEREYVVFDSNFSLDADWLEPN